MPRYERYPDESPAVAKQRIAKNVAQDKGNPAARPPRPSRPGARPRPGAAPVETKGEMMGEGYEAQPMTRGKRRKPGYNLTRNLGDTPDIGY